VLNVHFDVNLFRVSLLSHNLGVHHGEEFIHCLGRYIVWIFFQVVFKTQLCCDWVFKDFFVIGRMLNLEGNLNISFNLTIFLLLRVWNCKYHHFRHSSLLLFLSIGSIVGPISWLVSNLPHHSFICFKYTTLNVMLRLLNWVHEIFSSRIMYHPEKFNDIVWHLRSEQLLVAIILRFYLFSLGILLWVKYFKHISILRVSISFPKMLDRLSNQRLRVIYFTLVFNWWLLNQSTINLL
jgi:hypothetical protein